MVAEDAEAGNEFAKFVKDKITRKVVKRTVMTNVYGVTFMGAKLQVLDELKDIFPNFAPTKHIHSLNQPALYIAYKIFSALGKIFNGAQDIQHWLGECGERITMSVSPEQVKKIREQFEGATSSLGAKYKKIHALGGSRKAEKASQTFKTSIIWTTPLKMPVVQPYRKDSNQVVKTNLQDITVSKRTSAGPVDKRKQLQAFPPNFIHSLDATHMLLSALKCGEVGLDFAAVHDSFWTHAADIPNLNVILRDAFVRMHSEDIIGRLAAEFKARYANSMYRASIVSATPVGREIAAWRRNHRGLQRGDGPDTKVRDATFDEIALEDKRQELLNSEDPEKRLEGEAMVTPTSIWLANQEPKFIASEHPAPLGETNRSATVKVLRTSPDSALPDSEGAAAAAAIEAEAEGEIDEASTQGETISEVDEPGQAETKTKKRASKGQTQVMQIWLPLTFPEVPRKGTWDVSRLRESQYFFS